jgi:hypothetical protein
MIRTPRVAALLAIGSVLAACGGGGGGGRSPLDPTPTLAIEAVVVNADGLPTVMRIDLAFDGVHQGTAVAGTATTGTTTSPSMHTTVTAGPGAHSLRATIVAQTVSPSRYTLSATGQRAGQTLDLGRVTATVATGEVITLPFTL